MSYMIGLNTNKIHDLYHWFKSIIAYPENKKEQKAIADEVFFRFFGLRPDQRVLKKDDRLTESDIVRLKKAAQRLNRGEPVQHITGVAGFLGLDIHVDGSVLIPRPETEELTLWVGKEVEAVYDSGVPVHILDVGTGSGCIAISLASRFRRCQFSAIDISEDAINMAKRNADLHGVQIRFKNCDILSSDLKPFSPESFDCIVSNPPYVRNSEKVNMEANVLDYEPAGALFVPDDDPLLFCRAIALKASKWLRNGGLLFLEINEGLSLDCRELIMSAGFTEAVIKKDIHEKDRFIKAKK